MDNAAAPRKKRCGAHHTAMHSGNKPAPVRRSGPTSVCQRQARLLTTVMQRILFTAEQLHKVKADQQHPAIAQTDVTGPILLHKTLLPGRQQWRSEERRVGKEGETVWQPW